MYTLSEEQRWYIINEWEKGSIIECLTSSTFLQYTVLLIIIVAIIMSIMDMMLVVHLHSIQHISNNLIEPYKKNRSATAAELLSLISLGYRPHKSIVNSLRTEFFFNRENIFQPFYFILTQNG
jgi:hypothetical protein